MTIIRGIRSLSETYDRNFLDIPDTDENISANIILETEDESSSVKLTDLWPDFISLNASMSPVAISEIATVERIENDCNLGKMNIYNSPRIDPQSHVNNALSCCSKIRINFENTGRYRLENNAFHFCGKSFDDYEIKFPSDYLFEKTFLTCGNGTAILEKYRADVKSVVQLEYSGEMVKCRVYPYGGFFEYGAHPKQMESCVFRTSQDGKSVYLRISPITTLQSLGIDPTCDQVSSIGHRFIGVKNFSPSQKINLYDELKTGACKMEVTNKNTDEKRFYKSNAVIHLAKTNLITINFIKEEK